MSVNRLVFSLTFGLFVLVGLSIFAAFSAANLIPTSHADSQSNTITANDLKPPECASLNLTTKVVFPAPANGSANLVIGTNGADNISSLGGTDCILGQGGDDTLNGGAGVDILLGGAGNDTLYGAGGNDELYGGEGDDILYGGNNKDYLDGGPGYDICYGGTGTDTFVNCEEVYQN